MATETPPVSWNPGARGTFSRSFRLGEWLFEPVTPLFESWLLTDIEERLHEVQREQHGIVAPRPRHVVLNGWYFYSLAFLPISLRALARSFPALLPRLVRSPRRVLVIGGPGARYGTPLFEREWREDLLPRYRAAVLQAEDRVDTAEPAELVSMIDSLARLAGEYFASLTIVAGAAYKEEMNLARFWQRHLAQRLGAGHLALLAGLSTAPAAAPAHAVSTLDWWRPTRGELAPGPAPRPPSDRLRAAAHRREALGARARAALAASPRKARTFERLLAECQAAARVREEHVALFTLPWPVLRRAVARLGAALEAQGAIGDGDDVFFLRRTEVTGALDRPATSLASLVAERRQAWADAGRLAPPMHVGGASFVLRKLVLEGRLLVGAHVAGTRTVAFGVPASPGRATGRVRIVCQPHDGALLEAGDVLVAPLTAPAWTPLFARAGAVVTDVGSALAHASVVAREYGIPAVVGCGDATRRLRDGQLVTVDGDAGLVEDGGAGVAG